MRRIWLNLAHKDPGSYASDSLLYFCEDHFDLENDMENYIKYKIMGSVKRIQMKRNCIPSRFDCRTERKAKLTTTTNDKQYNNYKKTAAMPVSNYFEQNYSLETSTSCFQQDKSKHNVPQKPKHPKIYENGPTLSLFCKEAQSQPSQPIVPVAPHQQKYPFSCKACGFIIDRFSFWCVQCAYGPLCGACAQSSQHDTHFVMRAPDGATLKQTRAVLAGIRQYLLNENLLTLYDIDESNVKVVVKQEPEDRPVTPPPPVSLIRDPLDCGPLIVSEPYSMSEDYPEAVEFRSSSPKVESIASECVSEETNDLFSKRLMKKRRKYNIPKGHLALSDVLSSDMRSKSLNKSIPSNSPVSQSEIKIIPEDRTEKQSHSNSTVTFSGIKNIPNNDLRSRSILKCQPSKSTSIQRGKIRRCERDPVKIVLTADPTHKIRGAIALKVTKVQSIPKDEPLLRTPQNPQDLKVQRVFETPSPIKDQNSPSELKKLEELVNLIEAPLVEREYQQNHFETETRLERLEDTDDNEDDIDSKINKENWNNQDSIIDYIKIEVDDRGLDKDYRIDEEDRINEDTIDK
ncbi:uncharacterized protein LOC125237549 isoform X2 [Leguminivora glycinivorella]|nr:uncharacterized protein LOC125237549 isoform X2 [Leguminivora glycinivorella]